MQSGYHLVETVMGYLGTYLGSFGVYILCTFFFIAMVRIGVAFVFKIFRLNISYRTMQERNKDLWKKGS